MQKASTSQHANFSSVKLLIDFSLLIECFLQNQDKKYEELEQLLIANNNQKLNEYETQNSESSTSGLNLELAIAKFTYEAQRVLLLF